MTTNEEPESEGPFLSTATYICEVKNKLVEFIVTKDYEVKKQIGSGSYGLVCAATTNKFEEPDVAIKQVRFPAICLPRHPHPLSDFEIVALRTLREIRIVKFLEQQSSREKVNLDTFIKLMDILQLKTRNISTIYTVTQLMSSDLHAVLRNNRQVLQDDHVQYMLYNLLRGLHYLHSCGIVHRDVKPQNVLINDQCDVVLCDFGLAREINDGDMTVYVETRWYRAPELIMGTTTYDDKVDIWSVGCVFAEMLMHPSNRLPLWRGQNAKNQLDVILCTLGCPSDEEMQSIGTESARKYVNKMQQTEFVPNSSELSQRLPPNVNPLALDLLEKMLAFLPHNRWTALQCMKHEYLSEYFDPEEVLTGTAKYDDQDLEFVYDKNITSAERTQKLQDLLFEEMLAFHPELRSVA